MAESPRKLESWRGALALEAVVAEIALAILMPDTELLGPVWVVPLIAGVLLVALGLSAIRGGSIAVPAHCECYPQGWCFVLVP